MTIKTNKRDLSNSQVDKLLNMSDEEFEILFSEHFASKTLKQLIQLLSITDDIATVKMLARSLRIKTEMKG